MTDLEYVYKKDIQEKKSAGRGAFHKKNGSKSKKCTLPSDHLSRKEKMAMSGECVVWDMKKFYTWEEFKQMPDDIQLQYVNSIINRYGVGLNSIEKVVFGKSTNTLRKYLQNRNLLKYVNKGSAGSSGIAAREKLIAAMTKVEPGDPIFEEIKNKEEDKVYPEPKEDPRIFANCHSMQVEMDDWDTDILDFIKNRFAADRIRITITIDKES